MSRPKARPADGAGSSPTIEQVVELVVRHNLAEIEIERAGMRIRVVRERLASQATAHPRTPEPAAALMAAVVGSTEATAPSNLLTVEAPMVGTFYRAPSPEAAPFASEGDVVKEGQVLCIIEAMKLMNEIEAKAAGRIARVLVENGQPVEYGQPLFLLEPR